ncbi:MAG TPA: beta-glucosidase, partial [Candidatus Paenibacillus intestinavium]|nr:beta-glucosidase [Candidatus Paenibacillus intestinavium]
RDHGIEDVVTKLTANPVLTPAVVQSLSNNAQVTPVVNESIFVKVDEAGEYRLIVHIMSPETNVAQTVCNVTMNDQLMTTIQTNGTDGKWIKQKLVKVELEAGLYEMKLDFVKPGMQIEWIEFKSL